MINLTLPHVEKLVKHIVLHNEQVNLSTKEGRELKRLMLQLLNAQDELDDYTESISAFLAKQAELKQQAALAEKVLFARMNELQHKTLKMNGAVAEIVEKSKYGRVEPGYKELYSRAIEALGRFSMEQVQLLDSMKNLQILLKKSETVEKFKLTRNKPNKMDEQAMSNLFSAAKESIKGFFSKIAGYISSKFSKAERSADEALEALEDLQRLN